MTRSHPATLSALVVLVVLASAASVGADFQQAASSSTGLGVHETSSRSAAVASSSGSRAATTSSSGARSGVPNEHKAAFKSGSATPMEAVAVIDSSEEQARSHRQFVDRLKHPSVSIGEAPDRDAKGSSGAVLPSESRSDAAQEKTEEKIADGASAAIDAAIDATAGSGSGNGRQQQKKEQQQQQQQQQQQMLKPTSLGDEPGQPTMPVLSPAQPSQTTSPLVDTVMRLIGGGTAHNRGRGKHNNNDNNSKDSDQQQQQGAVVLSAEEMQTRDEQLHQLRILSWVSSTLSLFGALAIVALYMRHKRLRSFSVKLLLWLSIADFFAALSHLLYFPAKASSSSAAAGLLVPIAGTPEAEQQLQLQGSAMCRVQAGMQHAFFLSSFLWTLCIAVNQYVRVVWKERAAFVYELFYHFVAWVVPFIVTMMLYVANVFGPTDLWCWIRPRYELVRWITFYVPQLLIVLAIVVLSCITMTALRRHDGDLFHAIPALQRQASGLASTSGRIQVELSLYVFAFVLIRTPSVVHRIHELANLRPAFTLEVLHAIGSPLQGFVNCLLFLSNRNVRAFVQYYGWCGSSSNKSSSGGKSSGGGGGGGTHSSSNGSNSSRSSSTKKREHESLLDGSGRDGDHDDDPFNRAYEDPEYGSGLYGRSNGGGGSSGGKSMSHFATGGRREDDAEDNEAMEYPDLEDGRGDHSSNDNHHDSHARRPSRSTLKPLPTSIRPAQGDVLTLFVGTWNMGGAAPPMSFASNSYRKLNSWIPRNEYDMYAIGVQECAYKVDEHESEAASREESLFTSMGIPAQSEAAKAAAAAAERVGDDRTPLMSTSDHWLRAVSRAIGSDYRVLACESIGSVRLCVLVRKRLVPLVGAVRIAREATGIGHIGSNKGGVGVSVRIGQVALAFVNVHLAAHAGKTEDRNRNVVQIMRRLELDSSAHDEMQVVPTARRRDRKRRSAPVTGQPLKRAWPMTHHALFFFGDLNYRINMPRPVVLGRIKDNDWAALHEHDELLQLRMNRDMFFGFSEGELYFPPTYKYEYDSHKYDAIKNRTPSWTDRVLWKVRSGVHVQQTFYSHVKEISTSDHKPVQSSFRIGYPALLSDPQSAREARGDADDAKQHAWRVEFSNLVVSGVDGPHGVPVSQPYLTLEFDDLVDRTDNSNSNVRSVALLAPRSTSRRSKALWHSTGSVKPLWVRCDRMSRDVLRARCVVVTVRDNALVGDDDVAGQCVIELRPTVADGDEEDSMPSSFQVPVVLDTSYNGYLLGYLSVKRVPAESLLRPVVRQEDVVDDESFSSSTQQQLKQRQQQEEEEEDTVKQPEPELEPEVDESVVDVAAGDDVEIPNVLADDEASKDDSKAEEEAANEQTTDVPNGNEVDTISDEQLAAKIMEALGDDDSNDANKDGDASIPNDGAAPETDASKPAVPSTDETETKRPQSRKRKKRRKKNK